MTFSFSFYTKKSPAEDYTNFTLIFGIQSDNFVSENRENIPFTNVSATKFSID